jgi:AraC-like DNA-binding protein
MGQVVEILRDSTVAAKPASCTAFPAMLEETLRFEYHGGGVDVLPRGHTTGWRILPFSVVTHNPHGEGRLELDDKTYEGGNKGGCCILAGTRHRCTVLSKDTLSRWSHVRFVVLGGIDLFSLLKPPMVFGPEKAKQLGDINERLVHLMSEPADSIVALVRRKALGLDLLLTLLDGVKPEGDVLGAVRSQRILPALEYIHRHIQRALTLEELAKIVHLSPSRFYAVFRESLGVAPRDYILNQRMQQARKLLLTTDLSIAEVAESVGYSSQFQFSRVFKRTSAASPLQYRNRVRASPI